MTYCMHTLFLYARPSTLLTGRLTHMHMLPKFARARGKIPSFWCTGIRPSYLLPSTHAAHRMHTRILSAHVKANAPSVRSFNLWKQKEYQILHTGELKPHHAVSQTYGSLTAAFHIHKCMCTADDGLAST